MEAKKKPEVDLNKKKGLFFNIGLVITLALMIMAFEWPRGTGGDQFDIGKISDDFEDLLEIPPTEIPPPPPPKIQQPEIIEIPDDEEIEEDLDLDLDVDITEETVISDIEMAPPTEEETDEIFMIVEEQASFPGGWDKWYEFLGENIKYPAQARRMGIEGRVFLKFVVDEKGQISQIEVQRGIGGGCDEEAVRVLKTAPRFNPGKQRGKPVKSWMSLAINFRLN
jgi:protein TonB